MRRQSLIIKCIHLYYNSMRELLQTEPCQTLTLKSELKKHRGLTNVCLWSPDDVSDGQGYPDLQPVNKQWSKWIQVRTGGREGSRSAGNREVRG